MPRIALIHAVSHSISPINEEFSRRWPEASLSNLLDDSLSTDLANAGGMAGPAMFQRFHTLAEYAISSGAEAILFTCSAFGSCIEEVVTRHPQLPILKPNEAMIEEALRLQGPVGLIASFEPTLHSMLAEFPYESHVETELAHDALAALNRGDVAAHDAAVVAAAYRLRERGVKLIALAQFSLARAAPSVREALELPVLTTVSSALDALRRQMVG